ncbi:MAG: S-methyl-5-thioribose-1-phosphate isomerase [bacterium]
MQKLEYKNLIIDFENNQFLVLDQRLLPLEEKYVELKTVHDVYYVIKDMVVRGAPLIGIVALIGVYLGNNLVEDMNLLRQARPTAVNIFNYFNQLQNLLSKNNTGSSSEYKSLIKKFILDIIHSEETKNLNISRNGYELLSKILSKISETKSVNFLTHCNTGSLATIGLGTALGIIKYTHQQLSKVGGKVFVWVDETRPYLQGSRLTAWELDKEGIEFKIITDNSAAYVISKGYVDVVCVGADRIALNGDTANKIGTLNLAVLCRHYQIPFIVAAPSSSIDYNLPNLENFEPEQRNKEEVIKFKNSYITREEYDVYNPSFDITPASLIDYIVLENRCYSKPFIFEKGLVR